MLQVQVSKILDRSAFFLNDVNRAYFTNQVLIPPFVTAYDDLREILVDNNVALMDESSSSYLIIVGMKDIGGPTGPPLPVNFMAPYNCWERNENSQDEYQSMERVQFLKKTDILQNNLGYWQYSNQYIHFLGANQPREVKLDYIANNLSIADDPNSLVNAFNCQSYLAYRTAALASKYLGENESRSNELNFEAMKSVDNIVNMDVKTQQGIATRRIGFRSGYRNWTY